MRRLERQYMGLRHTNTILIDWLSVNMNSELGGRG